MLDRLRREDDGFTLVETLVAMIVFAILAVSVAGLILNTFDLTKSNTSRVVAANLASKQIEAARAMRGLDVPDGATVVTPNAVVNGVEYTVTQTANYVAASSGTSLCSGSGSAVTTTSGAELAYKLVTVHVTWPGMGTVQPVRQDTLLSLGIGFDDVPADKGSAAIAVLGRDDEPVGGVTVTLSPSGAVRTTGSDGCAVFTGLDPASTYSASTGQAGYVSRPGAPTLVSDSFTVTASEVTRVPMSYDRSGALAATLVPPPGLTPPATLELTLSSGNFETPERIFPDCSTVATSPHGCVSGQPRTASALFPGVYGVWPGTCGDARPLSPLTGDVTSSATASVSVPLGGVRVDVVDSTGQPAGGTTVYAVHAPDTSCVAGAVWALAPAGASSQSLALPPGTWTLTFTPDPNATGTPVLITAGAVESRVLVTA